MKSASGVRRATLGYLGLAAFCATGAALLPAYVYPALVKLPGDPQVTQVLTGTGVTILVPRPADQGGVRAVTADVVSSTRIQGRSPGDGRDPDIALWTLATSTKVSGIGLADARLEVISLDRRTAEPVNCCSDRLITDAGDEKGRPLHHVGYLAWPHRLARRDYPIWDVVLRDSRTAHYVGDERRHQLTTYRFESEVTDRVVGRQSLPGELLGLPTPSMEALDVYSTRVTYWVEPQTGAVVDLVQHIDRRFQAAGKVLPQIRGTLTLAHAADDPTLAQVSSGAVLLPWLRSRLSWVLGAVAAAALCLAAREQRSGRGIPVRRPVSQG